MTRNYIRALFTIVTATTAFFLSACHPGNHPKPSIRNERIEGYYSDFLKREAKSPSHREVLWEFEKRTAQKHKRQLNDMMEQVNARFERDLQEWYKDQEERRKQIQKMLESHPQRTDETFRQRVD